MQLANQSFNELGPLPSPTFRSAPVNRAVNVFWFASLMLSIFAALFGIFVKQWLHVYGNWSDIADASEAILVRDLYRNSFKQWRVSSILAALPVLLQLALLFFVAGLVTYLWTLDKVVAGILTGLAAIAVISALVAVVLPVLYTGCPYKSPLGLTLVRLLNSGRPANWRDRDLLLTRRTFTRSGEQLTNKRAYKEVCALLEITPKEDTSSIDEKMVATRLNELQVLSNPSSYNALTAVLSTMANSEVQEDLPTIQLGMLNIFAALVRSRRYVISVSVIQAVLDKMTLVKLSSFTTFKHIKAHLIAMSDLLSALVHCSARLQTTELADVTIQMLNCYQQWISDACHRFGYLSLSPWNAQRFHAPLRATAALRKVAHHPGPIFSVAVLPNGKYVASGGLDKIVRVWSLTTMDTKVTFKGHTESVSSVAWSPNGARIVSGSSDTTIRIWDIQQAIGVMTLFGHSQRVTSVDWSADGNRIVSGSYDYTIRLWDANNGTPITTFQTSSLNTAGSSNIVSSVRFSPNGERIAVGAGGDVGLLLVLDALSGQVLATLTGHLGSITSVAFSPSGSRVVSGGNDHSVRIWDAKTGALINTLSGHNGMVRSVAWSRDEARAISGAMDHTIRVWDVRTGLTVATFAGHADAVRSMSLSADGALLVSGSWDETIRVWNMNTGPRIATLNHPRAPIYALCFINFSPDGSRFASGSLSEDFVHVWDTSGGSIIASLRVSRDMIGASGLSSRQAWFSADGMSVTCHDSTGHVCTWTAPVDFPLPPSATYPPPVKFVLPQSTSPIFKLESGWLLGSKDSVSQPSRLYWVVRERRGDLYSCDHRVILVSWAVPGMMTLLDFTGLI